MLRKYFLIGFRSLRRKPVYTILNIMGLAIGMTVCILVGLYVHDELQFDRFHENADRIVQIGHESPFWGRGTATAYPLKHTLENEVPSIEIATHFRNQTTRLTNESREFGDDFQIIHGEPSFFTIFTFYPLIGDPVAALNHIDGIIVTENTTRKFFGDNDPFGKTLLLNDEPVTVLAVIEDPPPGSTIQFDIIASVDRLPDSQRMPDGWRSHMYYTYALLKERVEMDFLESQIYRSLDPHFENDPPVTFAIPLTSVYLSDVHRADGFRGDVKYLFIFGFAALFVLIIAGINYVNLATAQGMKRALEVGIRKTLGANRRQLALQFLTESVLVTLASLGLAIFLAESVLPAFNSLFEKELALFEHRWAITALCFFVIFIGIVSGSYPAFFLSRFEPVRVIYGRKPTTTKTGRDLLRKSLVVLQFAVSFLLMIGVSVIYYQLHFIQTKDLGFDGNYVALVNLRDQQLWNLREQVRERTIEHPSIINATISQATPGRFRITLGIKPEQISPHIETDKETIQFQPAVVDPSFIETLGMRIIAGRNFSPDLQTDIGRAHILNETFIRELGWTPEEAIGKSFGIRETDGEIIGVVEDFHLTSLHHEIRPVVFQLHEGDGWSAQGILAARIDPENVRGAIDHIQTTLSGFAPGVPFDYRFLDDSFRAAYRTEERLREIVSSFALLSIFIACLGLFGLAAFIAEQRTKEIGIRKVLGASITNIIVLLSKDFTKLVIIAIIIAAPVGYYLMGKWLEDFAYRIDLSWWIFTLAGLLLLIIAIATVCAKALRASRSNPVEALRYE